ncbi:SMI1/KNR4 family protein [Chryseobacterium sp. M5A1_1a]
MKTDFENIEAWLYKNAQRIIVNSLQKPVNVEQWEQFQKVMGKNLPDDFKLLYSWHNGIHDDENLGSLFYGMTFYSIDEILMDHENRMVRDKFSLQQSNKEIKGDTVFNPNWIRFAFDSSHTGLYLDLDPNDTGNYGQVIFIDDEYEVGILVADSISNLVHQFAVDLNNGLYHLHEDALEDGNHFLEAEDSIDLINWQDSEKWNRF